MHESGRAVEDTAMRTLGRREGRAGGHGEESCLWGYVKARVHYTSRSRAIAVGETRRALKEAEGGDSDGCLREFGASSRSVLVRLLPVSVVLPLALACAPLSSLSSYFSRLGYPSILFFPFVPRPGLARPFRRAP